jgi:co-chaperonin GroES (HSP10)
MKLLPVADKILVEPINLSEEDSFGLLRPSSTLENHKTYFGKVIAVPAETEHYKSQLKQGDQIAYDEIRTTKISDLGKDIIIIREGNVHFIISEQEIVPAMDILNKHREEGKPFSTTVIIAAMEEYANQFKQI